MTNTAVKTIANVSSLTGLFGLWLLWGHWIPFAILCAVFCAQSGFHTNLIRTGDPRYMALHFITTLLLPIIVIIGHLTK